jgi:tetratricopeptide (TPR) repeat protein
MLEQQRQLGAAIQEYMAALKADPEASYLWFKVGTLSLRLGDIERAAWAYSRAIADQDAPLEWLKQAAAVQTMAGRSNESLRTHMLILARQPGNHRSSIAAAKILLGRGEHDSTVAILQAMDPSWPSERSGALETARLFLAAGRPDLACGICVSNAKDEDSETAYVCAHTLEASGRVDSAAAMYLSAANTARCRTEVLENCFEALVRIRRADKALLVAEQGLACGESAFEWETRTILLLVALGKTEQATRRAERLLREYPEDGPTLDLLASLYYNSGNQGRALSLLARAVQLYPEELHFTLRLVSLLADQGDDISAIRVLYTAYTEEPDTTIAVALMSSWLESGFPERSIDIALSESSRDGFLGLIFQEAASWERLACVSRSAELFSALLDIDPKHAAAYNYLGYMLAERSLELERAVQLIQHALDLDPHNPYYLDSLGWAYYMQGRPIDALRLLRTAMENSDHEPEILKHVGLVLIELGEEDEGLTLLRRSLDGAPWDAELRLMVERLVRERHE